MLGRQVFCRALFTAPSVRRGLTSQRFNPVRVLWNCSYLSRGSPCEQPPSACCKLQTSPFSHFTVDQMGLGSSKNWAETSEGKYIQQAVASDCVVIFSKTTCSYCNMAKKIFRDMGIDYTAIEVNRIQGGDKLQDVLGDMTGEYTVPRVFIGGRCIGGGTEVRTLHKSGKLQNMILNCSVPEKKESIAVKPQL